MILRLENTTTHQEYQYDVVDVNNGEKLYFRFNINTLDLDDGEYTIKVYDGDELILTDILKIGDFNANSLQYKKSDNTYIEVELTAKIQEKEVDITDIATLVKPDSGFDGMSSVFVDAQPLYDAAYTEGYDEGREDGEAVSFDLGFEAGVKMQKAKLESISITENGTYTKEDGYNNVVVNVPDLNGAYSDGYDDGIVDGKEIGYNQGYNEGLTEGIENAGEIIAEEAQVLDITENGLYLTKYSDDIVIYPDQVTGEFPDGTLFYDWGEIRNGHYNTGIIPNANTRLEFWWKPTTPTNNNGAIIGAAYNFTFGYSSNANDKLRFRIAGYEVYFQFDNTIWHHFVIENGIVYDNDEQVGILEAKEINTKSPILINGNTDSLTEKANGYFGMVKIDDNIFIPKNGGFINYTTGEELPGYVANRDGAFYKYTGNDTTNITGYFDDGTPFYNYAQLENGYFNTKIPATPNSRLELWYKNDKFNQMYYTVIGAQIGSDFIFKIAEKNGSEMGTEYGKAYGTNFSMTFSFPYDNNWHHFIMSKSEGLVLDGVKQYDLTDSFQGNYSPVFYINCAFMDEADRNANGYFGMVKIDNHTFIPTEDGFINLATNEILPNNFPNSETPFDGEYTYTENLIEVIKGEGNLIKTLNVNVQTKIDVGKYGIKLACSTFKEVPDFYDFSNVTSMSNMFQDCGNLQIIPLIDTSNVSNFSYTFKGVAAKTIPLINTSKGNDFSYCFNASKIEEIPSLDLSNGENFYEFCYQCGNLKYVPDLDLSSATNINGFLENCNALVSVGKLIVPNITNEVTWFLNGSKNNLTDFGGLIGFRGSIISKGFENCPNLTYQSCINILNGLYDFTGNGETPTSSQGKLKVHSNFLTTVGDEISIATSKGWTITA